MRKAGANGTSHAVPGILLVQYKVLPASVLSREEDALSWRGSSLTLGPAVS